MSNIGAILPPGAAGLPVEGKPVRSQSYSRQVIEGILRRMGAVLGLIWIGILVVFAVFAPFVASTHPYLLKEDGHWSSPLLENLSAGDVVLQVLFWGALVFYFWPGLRSGTRWVLWMGLGAVAIVISAATIHPPKIVVYEQYREDQQSGKSSGRSTRRSPIRRTIISAIWRMRGSIRLRRRIGWGRLQTARTCSAI